MAEKNWTHLFMDGRRVSFDRRDHSVTLFPDGDFRVELATRIGYAEGRGNRWTATAPDGTTHEANGRRAAAAWLINVTAKARTEAESDREEGKASDQEAIDQAMAILNALEPVTPVPRPSRSPDAPPWFILSPAQMRDLLVALIDDSGPRRLPLAMALERVCEHEVVLFNVAADPDAEPHPFEWGYLSSFAFEDTPAYRPELGAYAEFWFERAGGEETMIGIPGLGSTALVTQDAIVVDEEDGLLVVVIAEESPDELDVPASNVLVWDRAAIVELAQSPPPVHPDEDEDEPEQPESGPGAA